VLVPIKEDRGDKKLPKGNGIVGIDPRVFWVTKPLGGEKKRSGKVRGITYQMWQKPR